MKVGIVIPFYGQFDLLNECLDSLSKQLDDDSSDCLRVMIRLLDTGSPKTFEISPALYKIFCEDPRFGFSMHRYENNPGVTIPWNEGIKHHLEAGADVVCVCNSDVVFGPDVLWQCAVAAKENGVSYPLSIQGGPKPKNFNEIATAITLREGLSRKKYTGGFAGWCFFLSRKVIGQVGMFDERFTLWYQDTDYHWRLEREKPPISPVEVQSCLIHHYESRTIKSMPGGFEVNGWRAQDAKRFLAKYPPC